MYALGLDFGTSGARARVIDPDGQVVAQVNAVYGTAGALADTWQACLEGLLGHLPVAVRRQVGAIAIDGTSATVLLCDRNGIPLTEPLLYNDDRGQGCRAQLQSVAPPHSPALSATSSLVKALWWYTHLDPALLDKARYLLHQADWLGSLLHGQLGVSDYHNALKLGYDVATLRYPDWLLALPMAQWFPQVLVPGAVVATLTPAMATKFDLPPTCQVKAGTTDSIAAFIASGAGQPGEAMTALGSTLVIKLLSVEPIEDCDRGIYSHRFGQSWLAGGASNTGGAVLRHFFADHELATLSAQILPDRPSGLNYYPLLKPGERFPVNDPTFLPQISPRPDDPVLFLQGLLEGIANIEATGYQLLTQLGGTPVTKIYTTGGGAQNQTWQKIRTQTLQVPIVPAVSVEAAYGAARLANQGIA
jgi:sugar (pentulose or hexulose) kinase